MRFPLSLLSLAVILLASSGATGAPARACGPAIVDSIEMERSAAELRSGGLGEAKHACPDPGVPICKVQDRSRAAAVLDPPSRSPAADVRPAFTDAGIPRTQVSSTITAASSRAPAPPSTPLFLRNRALLI